MMELGAAEGLYSVIFRDHYAQLNKLCVNVCVELMQHKVELLHENLPNAIVYHGYLGDLDTADGDVLNLRNDEQEDLKIAINRQKQYKLSDIIRLSGVTHIDILHVDIQGAEVSVLKEIINNKISNMIRYFFISTHDPIILNSHQLCYTLLNSMPNKNIILNDPLPHNGSGYGDGLIVIENLSYAPNELNAS